MTTREDGVERLRRWTEQARGVPPAFDRLGAVLEQVSPGTTAVRLPLTPELLVAGGSPTSAVLALLADFGLTTSVISSLPDLRGVTTVSMAVDVLALPPTTGALVARCTASPYDQGRPQHATGTLHDADGRRLAQASAWLLPTPAEAVSAERVGRVDEPPAADLGELLQAVPGTSFALVARDALSNAIGTLHGGIGALACSLAAEAALPDRRVLTASFAYLRPTPREGSVTVTGTALRSGRRTGTADAALADEDGRLLLSARVVTGSTPAGG